LGSAHCSWFDSRSDLTVVPSEAVEGLALMHQVPKDRVLLQGLPIREGFWDPDGRSKERLQQKLDLWPHGSGALPTGAVQRLGDSGSPRRIVLIMGGGEGFGAIVNTAIAIGEMLAKLMCGQMVVICGRNRDTKLRLEQHDWSQAQKRRSRLVGDSSSIKAKFKPVILGFVSNVDEYMGAADMLVTKAGPGTIAEAMIKGLPCLLTSFVPGQEEGNISFITENGAGDYVCDDDPNAVATTVASWLRDPMRLTRMSEAARALGRPSATFDIARHLADDLLHLGHGSVQVADGSHKDEAEDVADV